MSRSAFMLSVLLILALCCGLASAQSTPAPYNFTWETVVNNNVPVPGDSFNRNFNSYNQPSINMNRMVVMRARSKGGEASGEPAHGVFMRDMNLLTPLTTVFDRNTLVPFPNNLDTTFVEPPAFPRIDMWSNTIATRANHQPVWNYLLPDGITESRAGTTGIYTNPFGQLLLGASNLGAVAGFEYFRVPEVSGTNTKFDVFPGAPAVTDGATVVFKGNYSVPDPTDPTLLIGKTGVYFRNLTNAPTGGNSPFVVIANSDTLIPGSKTVVFGSTAPPSAVRGRAVFAGFDNEDAPTLGGIYMAKLTGAYPKLARLVQIGDPVPGEAATFNRLSEGLSYDGRFVAFWGAWGSETRTRLLQCPTDGNKNRIAYCLEQYPAGYEATVPVHQGIFVYDAETGRTRVVAKSPNDFLDFVYWNFSGKVPPPIGGDDAAAGEETGGGDMGGGEEDGEPARWRSGSFVAVSGLVDGSLTNATFDAAFKAITAAGTDGIYLRKGPDDFNPIVAVVTTGMDGTLIDPEAIYVDEETPEAPPLHLPVTAIGIERDGFRGNTLAITVTMGTEEAGFAGVYLTRVPPVM